jgi:Oxidoreductase family, C-terminal alpha/beta domain
MAYAHGNELELYFRRGRIGPLKSDQFRSIKRSRLESARQSLSGRIEVSDNLKSLVPARRGKKPDATADHIKEFLGCIRSRTQPRANADATAHTHIASHAAWISSQLNHKLTWDPTKRMFIGDEEANRMRSRAYREPWRLEALATSM